MLFEPFALRGLTLANRFVRSATCDSMAGPGGTVTDAQVELYGRLSEGKIGLIVSGHLYVRDDGVASRGMLGIDVDARVEGLARLAGAVHARGPSKLVAQINHGGRSVPAGLSKAEIVAPSALPLNARAPVPRALAADEVRALAARYGDAAARAKAAGFDGVQIHGAHGYLVGQFLSPLANAREDEFGGALENRARFLELVARDIRRRVGPDYPVLIKLGAFDKGEGGLTLEECVRVGTSLAAWGVDAIEVSGGIGAENAARGIVPGRNEGTFRACARAFKRAVALPVISVNGYRSLEVMEQVLRDGDADLIALCRPFIREPGLVRAFEAGAASAAGCISCNRCFMIREGALRCVHT